MQREDDLSGERMNTGNFSSPHSAAWHIGVSYLQIVISLIVISAGPLHVISEKCKNGAEFKKSREDIYVKMFWVQFIVFFAHLHISDMCKCACKCVLGSLQYIPYV